MKSETKKYEFVVASCQDHRGLVSMRAYFLFEVGSVSDMFKEILPRSAKMFALASPSGMVLDFEIFQTKRALLSFAEKLNVKPNTTIITGGAAVLKYVRSVDVSF